MNASNQRGRSRKPKASAASKWHRGTRTKSSAARSFAEEMREVQRDAVQRGEAAARTRAYAAWRAAMVEIRRAAENADPWVVVSTGLRDRFEAGVGKGELKPTKSEAEVVFVSLAKAARLSVSDADDGKYLISWEEGKKRT